MSDYENSTNSTSSNNEDNYYCLVCNHDETDCGCEDYGCCECKNKFMDIRSVNNDNETKEWYNEQKNEYFSKVKFINLWGEDDEDNGDTNDFLVELIDVVEKASKKEAKSVFEEIHQSTNIPTDLCNLISQMNVEDIPFSEETKFQDLFIDLVEEHEDYLTGYKIIELSKVDVCQYDDETFLLCQNVDIRHDHYAFNIDFDRSVYEVSYDGKDEYRKETYKREDKYDCEDVWIVQQTEDRMWLVVKIME